MSRLDALRDAVVAACHALGCTPNELVGWPSLDDELDALDDPVAIAYIAPDPPPPEAKQAADPMKPRRGMSPERDARIRELCEAGHSAMAIARRVGMTDMGVRMACQRMGLTPTTSRPKTTSTGT